jgi:transcription initiation factor TFIIIB Brf1 subunit/transcription initiation factor TFIIB
MLVTCPNCEAEMYEDEAERGHWICAECGHEERR